MSPENQGVFQLLKKVDFRRILGFFTTRENGAILETSVRGSVRSGWLMGLVLKISASLRLFLCAVLAEE